MPSEGDLRGLAEGVPFVGGDLLGRAYATILTGGVSADLSRGV